MPGGWKVCMRWMIGTVLVLMIAGCGDEKTAVKVGEPSRSGWSAAESGPSWHADVKPLLDKHCNGCHTEGGAGPFRLDDYASAKAMAQPSLLAIQSGSMPPWQPDPACNELLEDRLMPSVDQALFKAWVDAGAREGDLADAPPAIAASDAPTPDLETTPAEPYQPSDALPDDHRCLILDADFPTDTYVRGTQIIPGVGPIVHHVLVYIATPRDLEKLAQLDADEEGPGYTCYATSRVNNSGPIAAWVPGTVPDMRPPGRMTLIPAGSKLIMQMHYNILAAPPAPDLTTLQLFTYDSPQPYVIDVRPQPELGLYIPAGDPNVEVVKEFAHFGDEPITVIGAGPHMHVLGRSIKVELIREGDEKECLIDIPKWDFNWQQNYKLKSSVVVNPGDRFRLTCVYDNSAENQPVVNGQKLTPRVVEWGDDTLDEMCLNFIQVETPYEPSVGVCGGFEGCRGECDDPNDFGCVADCLTADRACGQCAITHMLRDGGCANPDCIDLFFQNSQCMLDCVIAVDGFASCMQSSCPEAFDGIKTCMYPKLESGACDSSVEACRE